MLKKLLRLEPLLSFEIITIWPSVGNLDDWITLNYFVGRHESSSVY
jgi:hypothetical protein